MKISGHTLTYALLADPVSHVRTPELYNSLFCEHDLDVVVIPVHVSSEDLREAVDFCRRWRNLVGFGVTTPHKEAVSKLVDGLSDHATYCGATNVVRRSSDGQLYGTQLDGPGMTVSLRSAGHNPTGKRALMVGAGGTAKGVAFALAASGLGHLTLTNRTIARAKALAAALHKYFPDFSVEVAAQPTGSFDLIINATSLGMQPGDPVPVDRTLLAAADVVADVVMTPAKTTMLQEAEVAGCQVHPGIRMLEAQFNATVQFLGLGGGPTDG